MFGVLAPPVGPNATARPMGDLLTPRLVPVFIQWGPSAEVKARSDPSAMLWPPAVVPRIIGGA